MLNRTILVGRLARDPELRKTDSGKSVASFTVACDRQGEGADFIKCVAWEKNAENLCKYQGKGDLIAVEGNIQVRNFEHEGQKRTAVEVVARYIKYIQKKESNQDEGKKPEDFGNLDKEIEDDTSDLPF